MRIKKIKEEKYVTPRRKIVTANSLAIFRILNYHPIPESTHMICGHFVEFSVHTHTHTHIFYKVLANAHFHIALKFKNNFNFHVLPRLRKREGKSKKTSLGISG
jgi:hypothetical protein